MVDGSGSQFCVLPARMVEDRRLGLAAIRVAMAIASYANKKRIAYPSLRQLATRLGMMPPNVARAIKELRAAGYFTIEKRATKNGGAMRNVYTWIFDADLPPEARAHGLEAIESGEEGEEGAEDEEPAPYHGDKGGVVSGDNTRYPPRQGVFSPEIKGVVSGDKYAPPKSGPRPARIRAFPDTARSSNGPHERTTRTDHRGGGRGAPVGGPADNRPTPANPPAPKGVAPLPKPVLAWLAPLTHLAMLTAPESGGFWTDVLSRIDHAHEKRLIDGREWLKAKLEKWNRQLAQGKYKKPRTRLELEGRIRTWVHEDLAALDDQRPPHEVGR
jgi:hypothetical protein